MIQRKISPYIEEVAKAFGVVTIMGPRQSGKTTLAKALFPKHEYRNLEAEDVLTAAMADPRAFLMQGKRPMLIDEVQRFPSLLTYIQEMTDENKLKGQFVITGSHQPELGAAISESLAGRTGICELMPLSFEELADGGFDTNGRDEYIWKGFMPEIYDEPIKPQLLYKNYFQTYVERDVRKLLNVQDLGTFSQFVRILAGRVGQLLNKESLASDIGISVPTVSKWLNLLEASYIIYRLRPYYNNFGKRQIKAPKIYFVETGLAAYLLGVRDESQLATHPLIGSLFENMVVMEAVKNRLNRGLEPDVWFYRNSSGSIEVDLLFEDGLKIFPREIKSTSTYSNHLAKGLTAFAELMPSSEKGLVVYAGQNFPEVAAHFTDTGSWCP
jgi:predicted AAA+ superfamily ATPase